MSTTVCFPYTRCTLSSLFSYLYLPFRSSWSYSISSVIEVRRGLSSGDEAEERTIEVGKEGEDEEEGEDAVNEKK